MSRAQAMIKPETALTKRKMIHVSKARPQKFSFMRAHSPLDLSYGCLRLALSSVRRGFKIRSA